MDEQMLFLSLGALIGFASSVLTLFAVYFIEGLRLQRQWQREDSLRQQNARFEMDNLADSLRTKTEPLPPITEDPPLSPVEVPTSLEEAYPDRHHPILADLDLDTLRAILSEEMNKPPTEQKRVLISRLQKAIEWFEKSEDAAQRAQAQAATESNPKTD